MKILLVEDDTRLANLVTRHLAAHHYVVDRVADGAAGLSYSSTFDYDLLILDLILPQLGGIELCQKLRADGDATPILLLTSEEGSATKIQALDAGADDYMVKPFDLGELEARIRALLRRGQGQASPLRMWGELLLNPVTGEVTYGDRPLQLTSKEYKLLELLISHGIHVVSVEEILERLWSSEEFPVESTVRSHVRRLRNKLQRAGAAPDFISTLHGRGYYLKPSGEAPPTLNLERSAVDRAQQAEPVPSPVPSPDIDPALAQAAMQMQYLQFLNETWPTAKQACLQEIRHFEQLASSEQRAIAHRLAGTLGMLGLAEAGQRAKSLEEICQQIPPPAEPPEGLSEGLPEGLPEGQVDILQKIREQLDPLRQLIEQTTVITTLPQCPEPTVPMVWILSQNLELTLDLTTAAVVHRLEGRVFENWQAVLASLEVESPPQQLIASLESLQPLCDRPNDLKSFQVNLAGIPLLILGQRDSLGDRLQALRLGGTFLLQSKTSAEQMLTAGLLAAHKRTTVGIQQRLRGHPNPLKVMLVDDDSYLLQTLLQQLNPFGFNLTTLASPQHFWEVFQSVQPDALVLDIKIPEINGFELCQVVRHDPKWKRLPILFLSTLDDPETRQRAFAAGADDYLFKPILGNELAQRILGRLARIAALSP
jgi:DNA-binding response OmpR family regulator/HPt (histidine-containing phosphotransfer) domain-containing protein